MVALSYVSLGSISGVSNLSTAIKAPASTRSRDKNDRQRMAFTANSTKPFSGIIHVQASVDDPTATTADWFDIAEMQIHNEGGIWSYEPIGEFASIRVICKSGNYWAATRGTDGATNGAATSSFTINGTTVNLAANDAVPAIVANINALAITNIVAEMYTDSNNINGALRIISNNGSDMILVDGVNTPLVSLGITAGTFSSGSIASITMLR